VLSGSLDTSGTDYVMKVLTELPNNNVFIISHEVEQIIDKFERILRVEKRHDFSVIV
jgi:energy-coupling factor transporter ATP-binding protein EcfA2